MRTFLAMLLVCVIASSAAAAERRPNIVVILADDKYESHGSEVTFGRRKQPFVGSYASIEIAGDCGQFMAIQ